MLATARSRTLEVASATGKPPLARCRHGFGGAGFERELILPGCIEDLMAAGEESLGERGVAEFIVDHPHGVGDAAAHEGIQDVLGDRDAEVARRLPPRCLTHTLGVDERAVHVENDCLHGFLSKRCLGQYGISSWHGPRFAAKRCGHEDGMRGKLRFFVLIFGKAKYTSKGRNAEQAFCPAKKTMYFKE